VIPAGDSFHVKICGLTRPIDAERAVDSGADLLGLNFVPTSSRCIDIACAQTIAHVVNGRARLVGVFVDVEVGVEVDVFVGVLVGVLVAVGVSVGTCGLELPSLGINGKYH